MSTVDSFQGGECRIVFSNMVITEKAGFVDNRGRVCVTSSRAKEYWILVGMKDRVARNDIAARSEQMDKDNKDYCRITASQKFIMRSRLVVDADRSRASTIDSSQHP